MVVIEDLISTGGSAIEVVNVLREAGSGSAGDSKHFHLRNGKGLIKLREANVKNISLTNFDTVIEVAAEEGYIKQEDIKRLIVFATTRPTKVG